MHYGQRLSKFCMSPACWSQICSKCITTTHKKHKTIDYSALPQEAKAAKDILLQAKNADLVSLKHLFEGVGSLVNHLDEAQKRRSSIAQELVAAIQRTLLEGTSQLHQIKSKLAEVQSKLKAAHQNQSLEIEKIPQLANAVVAKGTLEDLKTFFEMCQKGAAAKSEVGPYKRMAEEAREAVEEFANCNPLKSLFAQGAWWSANSRNAPCSALKDDEGKKLGRSCVGAELSSEAEEIASALMSSKDSFTPLAKSKTLLPSSIESPNKLNKLNHTSKLAASISSKALIPVTKNREMSGLGSARHGKSSFGSYRDASRMAAKKGLDTKGSAKRESSVPRNKRVANKVSEAFKTRLNNSVSASKNAKHDHRKLKITISELKKELAQVSTTLKNYIKSFSNMVPVMKDAISLADKNKVNKNTCFKLFKDCSNKVLSLAIQNQTNNEQALSNLLVHIDSTLERMQDRSASIENKYKSLLQKMKRTQSNAPPEAKKINKQHIFANTNDMNIPIITSSPILHSKRVVSKHSDKSSVRYELLLKKVNEIATSFKTLKEDYKVARKECIVPFMKCAARNYNKAFKKLFIKCYRIIRQLKASTSLGSAKELSSAAIERKEEANSEELSGTMTYLDKNTSANTSR